MDLASATGGAVSGAARAVISAAAGASGAAAGAASPAGERASTIEVATAGAGDSSGLCANTRGAGTSFGRASTTDDWLAMRKAANRPKPKVIMAREATTEAAMNRKFGSMPASP
jgi:hypothetical protein